MGDEEEDVKPEETPEVPTPEPPVPPVPPAVVQPVITKKTHLWCDFYGSGEYILREVPEGWLFDRRVTFKRWENRPNGDGSYVPVEVPVNLEHVDEDENGVWRYRVM